MAARFFGTVTNKEAVMATIDDFRSWLAEYVYRYADESHVLVEERETVNRDGDLSYPRGTKRLRVAIFTATNSYHISAIEYPDRSYLGCIASARTPRPGEKHTRGSDLADGELTKETFFAILGEIVGYEMQAIVRGKPTLATIQ